MSINLSILTLAAATTLAATVTFAETETTNTIPSEPTTTSTASTETSTTATPAEEKKFSIEYAENSPIKDVPLKNATLKSIVYYYGNPNGITEVTTDEDQKFSFKFGDGSSTVLSLVAIDGQDKFNASCSGNLLTNDTKMVVTCKPTKKV